MTSDFLQDGQHDPRGATLQCRTEVISDCSVVHVSGEVDLATIHILEEALNSAARVPHPVIVDLTATSYIDSVGIHLLLQAQGRHRQSFAVAGLAAGLKRIFTLTKVDSVIPVYDTLDAALSIVGPSSASSGI